MRRFIAAVVAGAVLAALAAPAVAGLRKPRYQRLILAARSQIGTPYVWGAESPRRGFDCSGLVQWAFRKIGIFLPRTTWGMMTRGHHVRRLRAGDAVFFFNGEHVGIYVGSGRFIDAPHTGARVGIRRLASYGRYTARRFVR